MDDTKPGSEPPEDKAKTEERRPVFIKAVKKKIGEQPGNLRRREAWYQKRTGGRSKPSAD